MIVRPEDRKNFSVDFFYIFSVNMLKLPLYESKEVLRRNLKTAMECSTGFGMA